MKIGFVFTNYNNSTYTRQAIDSIQSAHGGCIGSIIVVVDNSSSADDVAALKVMQEEFPCVNFIFNSKNVGYFEGLNIGLRFLAEYDSEKIGCVVVGNNDLVFPHLFFDQIENASDRFLNYPVIAPDILRIDGVHQNPHVIDGIGAVRRFLLDLYYSNYKLSRVMLWIANSTRRYTGRVDNKNHLLARPIAQGYGACYILGPIFFRYFKELWAPSFLMGEEYFLSHQISEKGLEIFFEPKITVIHYDHATVKDMPSKKLWEFGRAGHLLCKELLWKK